MKRRSTLYRRLPVSYVVVITVASLTFWLAGRSFAPFFAVFSLRPLRVTHLLDYTVAAFKPLFEKKGVELEVAKTLDKLTVQADAERTGQILANLVGNALRHTPPGGRVRLAAEPWRSGTVLLSVEDTGEGLAQEDLEPIFIRFYRVDKARGRETGGGSGIGLTLAKHYTEHQGGNIGVESRLGEESRFWFTLPCVEGATTNPRESAKLEAGAEVWQ